MEDFYDFMRLITETFFKRSIVMLKTKWVLFLLLVGVISLALTAYAADVTGEWDLTIQSQRGERTSTIKFVQDGESLTVTMQGMRGGEMEGTGTVKGNDIEWKIVRSTPRGEFEMVYKGTIEGDSMSGTADFGGRGEMEWTATKK